MLMLPRAVKRWQRGWVRKAWRKVLMVNCSLFWMSILAVFFHVEVWFCCLEILSIRMFGNVWKVFSSVWDKEQVRPLGQHYFWVVQVCYRCLDWTSMLSLLGLGTKTCGITYHMMQPGPTTSIGFLCTPSTLTMNTWDVFMVGYRRFLIQIYPRRRFPWSHATSYGRRKEEQCDNQRWWSTYDSLEKSCWLFAQAWQG